MVLLLEGFCPSDACPFVLPMLLLLDPPHVTHVTKDPSRATLRLPDPVDGTRLLRLLDGKQSPNMAKGFDTPFRQMSNSPTLSEAFPILLASHNAYIGS